MRCHPHWVMLAAGSDVESTKSVVGLRLFLYSALPVVVASIHIALDKSCRSRQRNLEIFLLYLFGVGGLALGGWRSSWWLCTARSTSRAIIASRRNQCSLRHPRHLLV
jgi:hypothetical protein